MRPNAWKWLFTWEGRVQRLPYFLAGIILAAIKYAIDRLVAAHFHEHWRIWNYALPALGVLIFAQGYDRIRFYFTLWAIVIPFFWIGVALTLRRLRDAGKHAGWIFLLFIPVANLVLFLWLTFVPGVLSAAVDERTQEDIQPTSKFRATLGIVLATALGLVLVSFGTTSLMLYGLGLFLGVPFLTGFVASWFLNLNTRSSREQTVLVSAITPLLIGLTLLSLQYEGLVCLLMALPLAFPFSIAGGLVARKILQGSSTESASPSVAACVAIFPFIMLAEHAANLEPPVIPVTTSITIDAPVSVVWKNVIAFPPLDPPKEWLFKTGIAYPTSARITGSGPGAVRYCRFSTGDFVEPITVWDENRLLAFDVIAQPPSMREFSPWKITPPHVERNYMRSQHGQFRLVALNDHSTLLEGTTWYQNYFWPQAYWREWSDAIVHRIHIRVLEHVKQQAEAAGKDISPR